MFLVFPLAQISCEKLQWFFVAIKPRAEDKIATTAVLLFYILKKKLTKCAYCINVCYFARITGTRSGASDS